MKTDEKAEIRKLNLGQVLLKEVPVLKYLRQQAIAKMKEKINMATDFDKVINRKGTHSLKYDFATVRGKKADILPLWVADMDFQAPKAVRERLFEIVEHGIFGYSDTLEDYFRAVKSWYKRRFDWEIESDWIIKTPGIVFALAMAVKAYTEPGESVLMLQPVYYPFREVIEDNGRKLIGSPLKLEDGHYTIDFEDMEKKIRENAVKLLLFCSPHNPVGRVWKREELEKVAALCLKYHVTLVSDEIHSDIVYKGHKHQMMASISEEIADITVTCTAPSKTFNVAGLQLSNIIISNPKLREKFKHEVMQAGYSQPNLMGMEACQAAYENGEEWLEELLVYLQGNVDFVRDYLKQEIPKIRLIEPEGTYLLWLDCRELGVSVEELEHLVVDKANLWLDPGFIFGAVGEGFERINIACPRQTLRQAMDQFRDALNAEAFLN